MENSEKYKLIVTLKELFNETFITEDDLLLGNDIFYILGTKSKEISLYASKVLQSIYENDELSKIFEDLKNNYIELRKDKTNFEQAINTNKTKIEHYIGDDARFILEYPELDIITKEFIFEFKKYNPKSSLYCCYNMAFNGDGILNFISDICTHYKGADYWLRRGQVSQYALTYDMEEYRIFKDEILSDEETTYNDKICITYDYYFLSKFEDVSYSATPHIAIFLFFACKRVLYDMLDYLYTINLSQKEKEERSQKCIMDNLTPTEREIYNKIQANPAITIKELGNINTINTHIRHICKKLFGEEKGIKFLKNHIAKNQ